MSTTTLTIEEYYKYDAFQFVSSGTHREERISKHTVKPYTNRTVAVFDAHLHGMFIASYIVIDLSLLCAFLMKQIEIHHIYSIQQLSMSLWTWLNICHLLCAFIFRCSSAVRVIFYPLSLMSADTFPCVSFDLLFRFKIPMQIPMRLVLDMSPRARLQSVWFAFRCDVYAHRVWRCTNIRELELVGKPSDEFQN